MPSHLLNTNEVPRNVSVYPVYGIEQASYYWTEKPQSYLPAHNLTYRADPYYKN